MKSNAVLDAIVSSIEKMDRIFVYRHTNPDPDAIGTQYGLVHGLQTSFPSKTVIAMDAVPTPLAWIGQSKPTVTPTADDLIIVVDCANHQRIAGAIPTDAFVIKIDHHPNNDPFGQLNWVDETYSSCAEMIYDLFASHPQQLTLKTAAATSLYAGIVGDTIRFSTPETSQRTLQIAANLAALGVDVTTVSHHEMDLNPRLSKLYGYVLSQLTVDDHGLGYLVLTQKVLTGFGLTYGEEDAVVALPGSLTNVNVWLFFIETPAGNFRVHFRSKALPINAIAKEFDGGGHPLASGAFVPDLTAVKQVLQRMQAYMND